MSSPEPSIGDLAISDLAQQLAETSKNLAIVRAQYRQLATFVESKADVLGLQQEDGALTIPQAEEAPVESAPETNGKVPAKTS